MKKFLLLIYLNLFVTYLFSQNVGIGTNNPDSSAALDVTSSTKGFLPPRMNTIERNAISGKAAGLMIFNTSTGCIEMYNGSNWINLCSSLPSSVLAKTLLGGNQDDLANYIQKTTDGGFIIGGKSGSSLNGDVTGVNNGTEDCWIVKLDSTGKIIWDKVLGGELMDDLKQIIQTSDGGYIFCATTASSQSGYVVDSSFGGLECWVVKLNASGDTTWTVLLGGDQNEIANSIQQTSDGGYILGAFSSSSDTGDVTATTHGNTDYWVVKLNASGTIVWDKLLGGSGEDELYSIIQTSSDGGYIASGTTTSSASGNVTGTINGIFDFWVIKLNASGNPIWNKLIGGDSDEFSYSIKQTSDLGYIVAGNSTSSASGNITGTNNGAIDYLIVKLDVNGNIVWNKLLGGNQNETAISIQQTTDGGYIVAGTSTSSASGNITQISYGAEDIWIVKLDASGTIVWSKLFGGNDEDYTTSIQELSGGDFIISGYTKSSANGSVIGTNHGGFDYWVLKIDASGNIL